MSALKNEQSRIRTKQTASAMSKHGKSDKPFKQALMMELANRAGCASAMNMREKPFKQALLMEAKALENGKPGNYPKGSLRAIAQALLFRASDGDVGAIREVADRIDGRVPQAVGGSDELGPQHITVTWREPTEPEPPSDPSSGP